MQSGLALPATARELYDAAMVAQQRYGAAEAELQEMVLAFQARLASLSLKRDTLRAAVDVATSRSAAAQDAARRLTFPAFLRPRAGELAELFDGSRAALEAGTAHAAEVISFTTAPTTTAVVGASSYHGALGRAVPSREEVAHFATLLHDGALIATEESLAGAPAAAGAVQMAEQPDEALAATAWVPFIQGGAVRRRSALQDVAVMRASHLGGRVLVARRRYGAGDLIFAEQPFLVARVDLSPVAPAPHIASAWPPLLRRVWTELLDAPASIAAAARMGWDRRLAAVLLSYLAQQTHDAAAAAPPASTATATGDWPFGAPGAAAEESERAGGGGWLRRRRLRHLVAPLQAMRPDALERLHQHAKFLFAALPPCYRDFDGDDAAAQRASVEWLRRGGAGAAAPADVEAAQGEGAAATAAGAWMAPYDENPAHQSVAVSPAGRGAPVPLGQGAQLGEAAQVLPVYCRVSVEDIARLLAAVACNCIALRPADGFLSAAAARMEHDAARALAAPDAPADLAALEAPAQLGVTVLCSLLEHSCAPNVAWVPAVGSDATPVLELRALRRIVPGERLRVAYVASVLPSAVRRRRLRQQYHFDCMCERCVASWDWSRVCWAPAPSTPATAETAGPVWLLPNASTGQWCEVSVAGVAAADGNVAEALRAQGGRIHAATSAMAVQCARAEAAVAPGAEGAAAVGVAPDAVAVTGESIADGAGEAPVARLRADTAVLEGIFSAGVADPDAASTAVRVHVLHSSAWHRMQAAAATLGRLCLAPAASPDIIAACDDAARALLRIAQQQVQALGLCDRGPQSLAASLLALEGTDTLARLKGSTPSGECGLPEVMRTIMLHGALAPTLELLLCALSALAVTPGAEKSDRAVLVERAWAAYAAEMLESPRFALATPATIAKCRMYAADVKACLTRFCLQPVI